jgi:hypothetical protein
VSEAWLVVLLIVLAPAVLTPAISGATPITVIALEMIRLNTITLPLFFFGLTASHFIANCMLR